LLPTPSLHSRVGADKGEDASLFRGYEKRADASWGEVFRNRFFQGRLAEANLLPSVERERPAETITPAVRTT